MLISLEGPGPLYRQVYRGLRELVLGGQLRPGTRLPPTRALAEELGVSRNVVLLAYEELVSEGYVTGRAGSGTYVSTDIRLPARAVPLCDPGPPAPFALSQYSQRMAARMPLDSAPAPAALPYDFDHGAASPNDFPIALWRKLTVRLLRAPSLDYIHPSGYGGLRDALATHLKRSRGVDCEPGQILIVNGSFQALDLTARVLLDPGDTVVLEDPHYPGAREVFLAAGARLKTTPVDEHGMLTDALPRQRTSRVKFAYVTPSHQFPSGGILPLQRRLALLAWAGRTGACIVEDDYDSEYRYGERSVEAMQGIDRGQRVIYVGTFSRILFPALRLGYIVLPKPLVPLFVRAKQLADQHSAPLPQQVLANFIQGGHFEHHIRKCRVRKAALRAALLQSLAHHFGASVEVHGASSGTHIMVSLRGYPAGQIEHLRAAAAARGVGVYPARPYYLEPPERSELVMGYGAMTVEGIRTGVRILADVVARPARKH